MDGVEKVFDKNKQDSFSLIDYQLMDRNENYNDYYSIYFHSDVLWIIDDEFE